MMAGSGQVVPALSSFHHLFIHSARCTITSYVPGTVLRTGMNKLETSAPKGSHSREYKCEFKGLQDVLVGKRSDEEWGLRCRQDGQEDL